MEVAAYRIIQEAVTNVIRHASASRCRVALHIEGKVLTLHVDDDGVGISNERRSGVGLLSMQERAQEVGGIVIVESKAGLGTRITAQLPLHGDA